MSSSSFSSTYSEEESSYSSYSNELQNDILYE